MGNKLAACWRYLLRKWYLVFISRYIATPFCLIALGFISLVGLALPTLAQNSIHTQSARSRYPAAVFWVAPDGDDTAEGNKAHPFRTLSRARDAARSIPFSKKRKIVIFLRDGNYRLQQPLVIDQRDSRRRGRELVFRAAPGETPVISGAIQVKDWSLYDSDARIYRAYVGDYRSRQLYVNGQRATRARTTSYPSGFLPMFDTSIQSNGGIGFIVTPLNPPRWADPVLWGNPRQIEAVIQTQWKMMRVPLDSVIPISESPLLTAGLITLQNPGWTNANMFYAYDAETSSYKPGIWSFWQVTRFENAFEFLDEAGEWYLDESSGWLYYIPLWGEDIFSADVELPVLEVLVDGQGLPGRPVSDISFKGLTFAYATWLQPSSEQGYVSDQSGFHLVGADHQPNLIGHDADDVRTPGNVKFRYAQRITFRNNFFRHLGAVGLDFDTGSQNNTIVNNEFTDISSAGIQIGGISAVDHHPSSRYDLTRDNLVSDNLICKVGREYVDSAGIFVGFTTRTSILHNTICDVPWAGIAIGWGWGLLDPGSFLGLPNAVSGMWGNYDTPTANHKNRIIRNRIEAFLNVMWDGGAIYTQGRQGDSREDGLLIAGNVAFGKRAEAGGNTFYTDGGSRYVTLRGNVSYDNPVGLMDFGSCPKIGDPLPYSSIPCLANILSYGSDTGGCRTYGDIHYEGNYWLNSEFYDPCPYRDDACVEYPTNLSYRNNHIITGKADVPRKILRKAGRRS